ncbi:MAG: response regulator [Bacteroidales bacterium]|jgi:DNA-binding LytR/AlgR family response regulator|nr:response regulator [Bacteroidales bacterium]
MDKINCLIVDDEFPALDLLEKYVNDTPFLRLAGRCDNAIEAIKQMGRQKIDLLFLDIQMPDLTGIELSKTIDKNCRIIFTTAFDEYALEGFKVNALDYLLKPFNYPEFLTAANRALEWFEMKCTAAETDCITDKYIFVRSEYRLIKVALEDIVCFEGLKDYVKIRIKGNNKPIMSLLSLKSLQLSLPRNHFMRVHRSFIISLKEIQTVETNRIIMSNKTGITLAEQYKVDFQHFIAQNSLS